MEWTSKLKNIGKNGSRDEKKPILKDENDFEKVRNTDIHFFLVFNSALMFAAYRYYIYCTFVFI